MARRGLPAAASIAPAPLTTAQIPPPALSLSLAPIPGPALVARAGLVRTGLLAAEGLKDVALPHLVGSRKCTPTA
jgi:hypothetical protein